MNLRLTILLIIMLFIMDNSVFAQKENIYDYNENILRFNKEIEELIANGEKVDIIHIGDSHVQSGYMTQAIREAFQNKYGNAGRGWESFHRLYRSNSHDDIVIRASQKSYFVGHTIARHNMEYPISMSGIEIYAPKNANISIDIDSKVYDFDNISIIRSRNSASLIAKNTSVSRLSQNKNDFWVMDTFSFDRERNSVSFDIDNKSNNTDRIYSGMYMYKSSPGVVVNCIGVNGATFSDYDSDEYVNSLSFFSPKMIIISLGTNDTYTKKFDKAQAIYNINSLISKISKKYPDALLVLTTPPPSYIKSFSIAKTKKRRKRIVKNYITNNNTVVLVNYMKDLAKTNKNLVVIDLFNALGGNENATNMKKNGMLSRDNIHYSVSAYQEHGNIIANLLLNKK